MALILGLLGPPGAHFGSPGSHVGPLLALLGLSWRSWGPPGVPKWLQNGSQNGSQMAPGRPPGREPAPGDPFLRKLYWHAHGSRVFEKPGYHGTGSARGERASSTASEARAGRAAEKRKNRSKGIESSRTAREARASLVASRRAWTIAGGLSHARSARALGRLRWEPLVHFLSVSLGACVEKSVPKIRRKMF